MLRVPLPFRGVAVLLLAATTVAGQTPEPPAELTLDPIDSNSPDFLRQYSADARHPLLQFMVDGELTAFDATPPQESSRLTPTPDSKSKTPATESSPHLTEVVPDEIDGPADSTCLPFDGPAAPTCLPFACPPPPPCSCRKCQRRLKHAHCGNYGPGCGNPYLGWPGGCPGDCGPSANSYPGCGSRGCRHKHGCGSPWGGGYGGSCGGYGGGCGMMGCDGFMDGGFCGSCMPYMAPPPPPPPPPCFCRKCQRKHGGCGAYGSPWGGGYGCGCDGYGGMGCGGFMDGCFGGCNAPPPPPPCHRCLRKHGCSYGYGYAGCGYPCWPAYPVPGANMVDGGCNQGHGLFHRCRGHHHTPPYPYYAYPPAMPCMMEAEPWCMDCGGGGDFCPALLSSGTCQ
jgi:hypothetical protein